MKNWCAAVWFFVLAGCSSHQDLSQFSGSWVFSEEQRAEALEEAVADIDPSFALGFVESFMSMQVDFRPIQGGLESVSTVGERELWRFSCKFREKSGSDFIFEIDSPYMSLVRLRLSHPNQIEFSFETEGQSDDQPTFILKLRRKPESNDLIP